MIIDLPILVSDTKSGLSEAAKNSMILIILHQRACN